MLWSVWCTVMSGHFEFDSHPNSCFIMAVTEVGLSSNHKTHVMPHVKTRLMSTFATDPILSYFSGEYKFFMHQLLTDFFSVILQKLSITSCSDNFVGNFG